MSDVGNSVKELKAENVALKADVDAIKRVLGL